MPRFYLIVLDGVGAGEAPDSSEYGDAGACTLGNLARAHGGLSLPNMQAMGLGNILPMDGVPPAGQPRASWGRMRELSHGKDTITGHWEMAGVRLRTPFPTYPHGFPPEVIEPLQERIGRTVLHNAVASGTEIIERLGDEHMRTGSPIVYTSADSVLQIAAHEDVIPVDDLYAICRTAREILREPHNVARVIARPFVGPPYERTYNRRDFPLKPPPGTLLDHMLAEGHTVWSVGKVIDMFAGRGFSGVTRTHGNAEGMAALLDLAGDGFDDGLVFANLVDFDTLYGHRNDVPGFARALAEFDRFLPEFSARLRPGDHALITADHGLDPTLPGTDHTREYVPVLLFGPGVAPVSLGTREGFWDVGATVAAVFGLREFHRGSPMLA
jgi:phosphopentomutase